MKSSTKRIFSILAAVILLVGAAFIYASLIKPAYVEIQKKRAELAAQKSARNKLEAAVNQIKKLLVEYQDAKLIQETVSAILPVEQMLPQSLAQITGLAENSGLFIQSLGSQPLSIKPSVNPKLIKGVGTLRFNIRLAGSYESFKSFLNQMANNIQLMDLTDLKMEPVGGSNQNIFLYTITVDTYYQAP